MSGGKQVCLAIGSSRSSQNAWNRDLAHIQIQICLIFRNVILQSNKLRNEKGQKVLILLFVVVVNQNTFQTQGWYNDTIFDQQSHIELVRWPKMVLFGPEVDKHCSFVNIPKWTKRVQNAHKWTISLCFSLGTKRMAIFVPPGLCYLMSTETKREMEVST